MVFNCPHCNQRLSVKDELAGHRGKCPKCQQPLSVPMIVGSTEAVSQGYPLANEPRPAASARPGAVAPQSRAPVPSSVPRAGPRGGKARCYYAFSSPDRAARDVAKPVMERLRMYLGDEGLDFEYVDCSSAGPFAADTASLPAAQNLGPQDIALSCDVTDFDYGSRAIRYWLTPIALFGPGSCKLSIDATLITCRGVAEEIRGAARQCIGFLGGSDDGMMKLNTKVVGNRIGARVARKLTGRRPSNTTVYQLALVALILGVLSLMCFPVAVFGMACGGLSLVLIRKRKLPKRMVMALSGVVLSTLGLAFWVFVIFASSMR